MSQAGDNETVPDDVRRFVLTSIPSVPFMEAMLLFKALAGQPVATRSVAERLYVGEKQAAQLVEQLRAARIVESAGADLDRVAHAYVNNLIGVTRLIHSRTERMAHQFADAFKFRKDP